MCSLVDLPDPFPVLVSTGPRRGGRGQFLGRDGVAEATYIPFDPQSVRPGWEVAGTVAAVGEGVDNFEIGTPVFGTVGPDASGGYAELALAYAGSLIPVPAGLIRTLLRASSSPDWRPR